MIKILGDRFFIPGFSLSKKREGGRGDNIFFCSCSRQFSDVLICVGIFWCIFVMFYMLSICFCNVLYYTMGRGGGWAGDFFNN